MVKDKEAWRTAVHRVAESRIQVSEWMIAIPVLVSSDTIYKSQATRLHLAEWTGERKDMSVCGGVLVAQSCPTVLRP